MAQRHTEGTCWSVVSCLLIMLVDFNDFLFTHQPLQNVTLLNESYYMFRYEQSGNERHLL